MIVNLHTNCKVQLNDYGKQIWNIYVENIPEEIKQSQPQAVESLRAMLDENDCIEAELLVIMSIFGRYMTQELIPFTVPTMTLSINPNFRRNNE